MLAANLDSPAKIFDMDEGDLTRGFARITHSDCGSWSPGRSSSSDFKTPIEKPGFARDQSLRQRGSQEPWAVISRGLAIALACKLL